MKAQRLLTIDFNRVLRSIRLLAVLAFVFSPLGGCELVLGDLPPPGGSAGTGGAGGQGGGAAGYSCAGPAKCPDPMNECVLPVCKDGFCHYNPLATGIEVVAQQVGNCSREVCDGDGSLGYLPDPRDAADDGNACTVDICGMDGTEHVPVAEGTPCGEDGEVCSADGKCVACNAAPDCPDGATCKDHLCVDTTCNDGAKDGNETDIDCGGPGCVPCGDGQSCIEPPDCASYVCLDGKCQPPTCDDGAANGAETDIDCGSAECGPCPLGASCADDAGCISQSCTGGTCVPSCTNGMQEGTETDVDCGGACDGCDSGKACEHGYDCKSNLCLIKKCL